MRKGKWFGAGPTPRLGRPVSAIGVAVFGVGLAYGAMSTSNGLPFWFAPGLGIVVLAASAEMLFVGMVVTGASPILALVSTVLINVRHLPYGFAVADALGADWRRWFRAHLINDESVAMALSENDTYSRQYALTATGLSILVAWPLGAVIGGVVGHAVAAETIGLDAAFPVVMLSLLAPHLTDRRMRGPLVVAMTAVAVAGIWLPSHIAILAAVFFPIAVRGEQT